MKITTELKELEGWKRVLEVEVPVEEVQGAFDELVSDYRRRMVLPGFRKGKVPESVVRQTLAGTIDEELLNRIVPKAYSQAMGERNLVPANQANVDNLQYKQGEPLRFTAHFELRPEAQPKDYKGLKLREELGEVLEEDVDRTLQGFRERSAEYPVVEAPAGPESIVIVDYDATGEDGKRVPEGRQHKYPIELGGEGLLPAFKEGLLGAVAAEGRTIHVDYPSEFRNAKLAGRRIRYDIKIREIREKKLPELDDNLARERFGAADLADLRARVRLRLEGEERLRGRERMESAVVDEVVSRNEFAPPESMVEELLDRLTQRAQQETGAEVGEEEIRKLREQYQSSAVRAVRRQLLWEGIARLEKLEVAEAEVEAEVLRIRDAEAGRQGGVDERTLRSEAHRTRIQDALLDRKIFELLIQNATVETVTVPRNQPGA